MNKQSLKLAALALAVLLTATGCSSTQHASDFNNLPAPEGKAVHLSTTNVALHFLFGAKDPIVGNATLEKTVSDFTAAAKAQGAKEVDIVQSSKLSLWFIFPPISFFITPVITNVAGDAIE